MGFAARESRASCIASMASLSIETPVPMIHRADNKIAERPRGGLDADCADDDVGVLEQTGRGEARGPQEMALRR